ncbi:MAG: PRC-barrel domain-containing protein [Methanosphaera sp.]|nr:PRC-barrel domain-containing protein [Methanosphaera sp.]
MNAKDLLGKKIIDKNAMDLAKLADITFDVKTFKISQLYGSLGNPISKKYYAIGADKVLAIGDYIQVDDSVEEIDDKLIEKIPEIDKNSLKANSLLGKTVLNANGNVLGKVSSVDIELKDFKIDHLTISGNSSSFSQSKNAITINQSDIGSVGDYILINKVIDTEEKSEETKTEEESKEKVDVNIE